MTGKTRDYLADLANRKGVTLPGFQDADQATASKRIEELKALPDKVFTEPDESILGAVQIKIDGIIKEINKWTFGE